MRMGEAVQTVPLITRLHQEWPGVAVDLVVDREAASMASLLMGLRHVVSHDFGGAAQAASADTGFEDHDDLAAWAKPLSEVGYDRVINLAFTRWSGRLAALIGGPDVRGAKIAGNGSTYLANAWLTHFVDLHHFRRLNRFHLTDLFALGGSGPGSYQPIRLAVPSQADEWAKRFLHRSDEASICVAVHVGGSNPVKAWRPEYFGQTMAMISRRIGATFVLIGSAEDASPSAQASAAYRAAGGVREVCSAVGQTDSPQLAALLQRCRLLLTNDAGPLHVAAGVGTPVVDLSVGHASFHETGPHGPGHWVLQPTIGCAPCDDTQVCSHHACKDQVAPDELAELCLHVLGAGPFPTAWTGVRIHESALDADNLGCYRLRAGQEDALTDWYAQYWRRRWYETYTGRPSGVRVQGPPPDLARQGEYFQQIAARLEDVVKQAEILAQLAGQGADIEAVRDAQTALAGRRQQVLVAAMQSLAFGPATVAFMRDLYNSEAMGVTKTLPIYRNWQSRLHAVIQELTGPIPSPMAAGH